MKHDEGARPGSGAHRRPGPELGTDEFYAMAAEKFNAAGNDAVTNGNYEAAVRVSLF